MTMSVTGVVPPQLNIFSPNRSQNAILGYHDTDLRSQTAINHPLSTLEFISNGGNQYYRDLSECYLGMTVAMRAEDGSSPPADTGMGVVNNLLYSLFQTMEVYFNEKLVIRIDHFGYVSYISTLLGYGQEAAKTHLTSNLFYLDSPTKVDVASDENEGFKTRKSILEKGKVCELYGRLKCGLFDQPLLIPQGIDMRIKLTFAPEKFYLWSGNESTDRLHVMDAHLKIRQVVVNPGVLIAHAKVLSQNNALYPLKTVEAKAFTVPPGGRSISINSVCSGKLPTFLCFAMVPNLNFNGDIKRNPFAFVHKSISNVSIYVNAQEHRIGPIDFHSTQPHFTQAYYTLFSAFGADKRSGSHMITPEMFAHGSFLICKDLTPDASGNLTHTSLAENGVVRIECSFAAEFDTAITCLVLLEYDAVLEIDVNRNFHIS